MTNCYPFIAKQKFLFYPFYWQTICCSFINNVKFTQKYHRTLALGGFCTPSVLILN